MKAKRTQYGRCENCRGKVVERQVTVDRRFRGKLFEFENVPVGVCVECGQRIYKGPILEQMERMSRSRLKVKRTLRVPVTDFLLGSIKAG